MGKKSLDCKKKTIEELALLAVSKTGLADNIAEVTKKVITDYIEAQKTINEYNKSQKKQQKQLAEVKYLEHKNREKKKSAKKNVRKKVAGE